MIQGISEAEEFLRLSVVQASANERGNYAVKLTPEQAAEYKDDDVTVRMPGEDPIAPGVGGCGNS